MELRQIRTDELRTKMWSLATHVRDLQTAFAEGKPATADGRAEIARILGSMEETAMSLDARAYTRHHADASLGAFRSELRAAREGAERDPPEYYFAGRISGSCAYCHR